MSARSAVMLVALAGLVACSNAGPPPTNVAFDRPGRFVFACFDVSTTPPTPHSLAYCNPSPVDGTFQLNHDLHAIVIQTARGQLGLVDVQPNATAALIDSNPTVPGYTFLTIGDQPVDIVATDDVTGVGAPLTTYVAHRGSRDLWWIATAQLRRVASTLAWQSIPLGAVPTSMVLSPNEDFLYVALSDIGVIRQFPISRTTGALGTPTDIFLSPVIPDPVPPPAGTTGPTPWEYVCAPVEPPPPVWLPPRTARSNGGSPAPSRLVVKSNRGEPAGLERSELIVGDANLPVIRALPINDDGTLDVASLQTFNVGTPTTDLALTPLVPDTNVDSMTTDIRDRYLYAIDDHGDVMAVDWTLTSPTHGIVLPVAPATTRPGDRMTFGTIATSLGMLLPSLLPQDFEQQINCGPYSAKTAPDLSAEVIGPAHLRGVFLAVGLADGTVRIVDIWDQDAYCRGIPQAIDGRMDGALCSAAPGSDPTDETIFVRRHRPRIGTIVTSAAAVTTAPTFTVGVANGAVDDTGSAGPGLPSLVPIGTGIAGATCENQALPANTLTGAFPVDSVTGTITNAGAELVCIGTDPWATIGQNFTATWDGALVGNVHGRFGSAPDGTPEFFASGVDFCGATVVGSNEAMMATPIDPEFTVGDQLVIVEPALAYDPTDPSMSPTDCMAYQTTPAAFQITRAFADGHLELGSQIDPATGAVLNSPTEGLRLVRLCYRELALFEVRSQGSWVVFGGASGVPPSVLTGAGGVCTPDPSAPANHTTSRALPGQFYVNRETGFEIADDPTVTLVQGSTLTFGIGNLPIPLSIPAGTLPVAIQYSTVDQKMYVMDPLSQGLTRILLDGYVVDVHYNQ